MLGIEFGRDVGPADDVCRYAGVLLLLMILKPAWFKWLSVVFAGYTALILYLTA